MWYTCTWLCAGSYSIESPNTHFQINKAMCIIICHACKQFPTLGTFDYSSGLFPLVTQFLPQLWSGYESNLLYSNMCSWTLFLIRLRSILSRLWKWTWVTYYISRIQFVLSIVSIRLGKAVKKLPGVSYLKNVRVNVKSIYLAWWSSCDIKKSVNPFMR